MVSAGFRFLYSILTWERRGLLAAPWWVMFGCYAARWLDKVSRGGVPRELQKRSVCIAEDIGTALHLCRDQAK